MQRTTLFLDLDGVFADFDGGVRSLLGEPPNAHNRKLMWQTVKAHGASFWGNLKILPGADKLWKTVKHLKPTFLTGTINDDGSCEEAKILWVKRHFHTERIICCAAKDKPLYMRRPGDVLVDDRIENIQRWESAGGIGVLHTDAERTVDALRAIGLDV